VAEGRERRFEGRGVRTEEDGVEILDRRRFVARLALAMG